MRISCPSWLELPIYSHPQRQKTKNELIRKGNIGDQARHATCQWPTEVWSIFYIEKEKALASSNIKLAKVTS